MPLIRCDDVRPPRLVEADPVVETRHDALYVPRAGAWVSHGWGLYDAADRLVVSAARWSGSPPAPASGAWTAPEAAVAVATPATPGIVHVYAGLLEAPGIGGAAALVSDGLLLDCLARFWSHATGSGTGARLLFHTGGAIEAVFADATHARVLAAFGISPSACVAYDAPCRLDCVVVPAPAFESGRLAHAAFARLAATLAMRLSGGDAEEGGPPRPGVDPRHGGGRGRPVHLSSARLPWRALPDEAAFDALLAGEGVAIVHPGEVSVASLASRLRAAPLVSSLSPPEGPGNAVLQALRPAGASVTLSIGGAPAADALLVDAACGHETLHLRPLDPGAPGPAAPLAEAMLRAMERLIATRRLRTFLLGRTGRPDVGIAMRATGGTLAASRSSDGDGSPDALLGGPLTGRAQMRTLHQQRPWWQVDLGAVMAVEQLRVHAPVGAPPDAPTDAGHDATSSGILDRFRLCGSLDGTAWQEFAVRDDARPVGGIDGGSHLFACGGTPWEARFLRLQSLGDGVLALDQVEIVASDRQGVGPLDIAAGSGVA